MKPLSKDDSSRDFSALLCIDSQEVLDLASGQLTLIGFEVHTVSTPEQALAELYSHSYAVMVVDDHFGGSDIETHPLLSQMASVPLDLRRKTFVILIGPNLTPHSKMQAFALSVDLVLRPQDILNLKAIVGQGLLDHEAFYAAFNAADKSLRLEG